MSNTELKTEKKCKYFNSCVLIRRNNCEGCNIYEYTHNFGNFIINLQAKAKNHSIEEYLKYFKNAILS